MMKHILATSALATLLATGLHAQTEPAADPAQDPAAPIVEGTTDAPIVEGAEGTMDGSAEPSVAASPEGNMDDGVMTPDATAADDVEPMDGAADPMVAEPAEPMEGDDATVAAPAEPMDGADPTVAGDWAPIDLTTISTEQLIGADITTHENETIATIEDVLITDDGQVENIVARFGGFLGFGSDQVLLTTDELEVMMDADESLLVRTDLTPESLEGRPVYEEEVEG